MKITDVTLRHSQMKLKSPLTTRVGPCTNKDFLLLEAKDEKVTIGWGESVTFEAPWYNEETLQTNWHTLQDFLIPLILKKEITHPDEVNGMFAPIRKNN